MSIFKASKYTSLLCINYSSCIESEEDFSNDPTLSITFSPSVIYTCADITIVNDEIVEDNQYFLVKVGSIDCETDPSFSLPPPARVVIIDDDG